jgi:thiol:disulfide interchange protein
MSRWGSLFWVVLLALLVYAQWPMLKGTYYKVSRAEAPKSEVKWRMDYQAALDEAKQTGKPVLIDFTASWCPPCRVMKHEVWPNREVAKAANDGYVPLLVDVDEPKNAQVAERYGIQTIPSIFVVDGDGQVVRQASFMTADDMIKFLKRKA